MWEEPVPPRPAEMSPPPAAEVPTATPSQPPRPAEPSSPTAMWEDEAQPVPSRPAEMSPPPPSPTWEVEAPPAPVPVEPRPPAPPAAPGPEAGWSEPSSPTAMWEEPVPPRPAEMSSPPPSPTVQAPMVTPPTAAVPRPTPTPPRPVEVPLPPTTMHRSAELQATPRLAAAKAPRRGKVIACVANKGGVGKTTVACYSALAIARSGRSVVLVDANIPSPNVAGRLGLGRGNPTIAHLARGGPIDPGTVANFLVQHPLGFDVLLGGHSTEDRDPAVLTPPFVLSVVQTLAATYDVVVLDTAQLDRRDGMWTGCVRVAADRIIWVTDHDRAAVEEAVRTLTAIANVSFGAYVPAERIAIIINDPQAAAVDDSARLGLSAAEISAYLSQWRVVGELPRAAGVLSGAAQATLDPHAELLDPLSSALALVLGDPSLEPRGKAAPRRKGILAGLFHR